MRIGFCADVHLGNHRGHGGPVVSGLNDRARAVLAVLRAAVLRAHKEGCSAFVVLGDLFDTDAPSPQMLAAAQMILSLAPEMRKIVLMGNHDQHSMAPGDHALGPLVPVAQVVTEPTVIPVVVDVHTKGSDQTDLVLIPFRPGNAADWFEPALMELAKKHLAGRRVPRVLGIHLGVRDERTAPFLQDSPDAIGADILQRVGAAYKFMDIYAGNWHNRRRWKGWGPGDGGGVTQIGALVPTGHDNPGVRGYGHLDIWDSEAKPFSVELPGPRFVSTLEEVREAARFGNIPYLRTEQPPGEDQQELVDAAELAGAAGVEVAPWRAGVAGAARGAALAASGATTLGEALADYVERAPLGDGVDRADVLARCRAYLRMTS